MSAPEEALKFTTSEAESELPKEIVSDPPAPVIVSVPAAPVIISFPEPAVIISPPAPPEAP